MISSTRSIEKEDCRWDVLAGLRFFLAFIVVCAHLPWFCPSSDPLCAFARLGGLSAVLGFLIVSGYSIAHSITRQPIGFYRRRVLRIYPLYAAAILLSLIPFLLRGPYLITRDPVFEQPRLSLIVGNLLLLENLFCRPIDSDIIVWTLGVEIWCYALAPWFRTMPTWLLLLPLALSSAAFGFYPGLKFPYYSSLLYGLPLLFFAWAWLAGFIFYRYRNHLPAKILLIAIGCVLIKINSTYNGRLAIETYATAALLLVTAPSIPLPPSIRAALRYAGDLSYPLYLFHFPSLLLGFCVWNITSGWELLGLSLAVSAVFLFVEMKIKRMFVQSRTRS